AVAVPLHRVRGDGEDDARGRLGVVLDLAGRLPSRDDRERQIHQNEIGSFAPRGGDPFAPVGRKEEPVARGLEQHPDELADVGGILHDEDPRHQAAPTLSPSIARRISSTKSDASEPLSKTLEAERSRASRSELESSRAVTTITGTSRRAASCRIR